MDDSAVYQEFYCRKIGGGCGGYILIKLRMGRLRRIRVVCPKCQHRHERMVENGHILDDTNRGMAIDEEFTPLMSAWSLTPRTKVMKMNNNCDSGSSVRISEQKDLVGKHFLRQSWFEKHARAED